jgi:hypothetical protein
MYFFYQTPEHLRLASRESFVHDGHTGNEWSVDDVAVSTVMSLVEIGFHRHLLAPYNFMLAANATQPPVSRYAFGFASGAGG